MSSPSFTMPSWDDTKGALNNYVISPLSDLVDFVGKNRGSAENPYSYGSLALEGFGLLQKQNMFKDQMAEARRQFAQQKAFGQSNFLTQGTNFLNQSAYQLQAMDAFNPQEAAKRAQDLGLAIDNMNQAGSMIGLGNNAFGNYKNNLEKYNTLKA